MLQTNCGKEFLALTPFLESSGSKIRYLCPYTHQQIGVVERKHRHLVDTAMSMLCHASMPLKFWDEAIISACYLINILPSSMLNGKTSHELLFNSKTSYSNLRVGCSCYRYMRPYNRQKFEFQSTPSNFVDYSTKFKSYRCLTNSGKVIYTRNVLFHKTSFPFKNGTNFQTDTVTHIGSVSIPSIVVIPPSKHPVVHPPSNTLSTSITPYSSTVISSDPTPLPTSLPVVLNPPTNNHQMVTSSKTGNVKPKAWITIASDLEPSTVKDAKASIKWQLAMKEEFDALLRNKT